MTTPAIVGIDLGKNWFHLNGVSWRKTSSMPTLQKRIDAIVKRGGRPIITLFPGMEILIPKQRVGRPRTRDQRMPFKHYADLRNSRNRARCLAKGCRNRLRVDQRGACCEECADRAFNDALLALRVLGVTKAELLQFYSGA